jgi:hypothetical protein
LPSAIWLDRRDAHSIFSGLPQALCEKLRKAGQFHIEIKGLAEPKSKEASRSCSEDSSIRAEWRDRLAMKMR